MCPLQILSEYYPLPVTFSSSCPQVEWMDEKSVNLTQGFFLETRSMVSKPLLSLAGAQWHGPYRGGPSIPLLSSPWLVPSDMIHTEAVPASLSSPWLVLSDMVHTEVVPASLSSCQACGCSWCWYSQAPLPLLCLLTCCQNPQGGQARVWPQLMHRKPGPEIPAVTPHPGSPEGSVLHLALPPSLLTSVP